MVHALSTRSTCHFITYPCYGFLEKYIIENVENTNSEPLDPLPLQQTHVSGASFQAQPWLFTVSYFPVWSSRISASRYRRASWFQMDLGSGRRVLSRFFPSFWEKTAWPVFPDPKSNLYSESNLMVVVSVARLANVPFMWMVFLEFCLQFKHKTAWNVAISAWNW